MQKQAVIIYDDLSIENLNSAWIVCLGFLEIHIAVRWYLASSWRIESNL